MGKMGAIRSGVSGCLVAGFRGGAMPLGMSGMTLYHWVTR